MLIGVVILVSYLLICSDRFKLKDYSKWGKYFSWRKSKPNRQENFHLAFYNPEKPPGLIFLMKNLTDFSDPIYILYNNE